MRPFDLQNQAFTPSISPGQAFPSPGIQASVSRHIGFKIHSGCNVSENQRISSSAFTFLKSSGLYDANRVQVIKVDAVYQRDRMAFDDKRDLYKKRPAENIC